MNEIEMLRKLGSTPRGETEAAFDVTDSVLRDIAARRNGSRVALGLAAAGACAAAAAVAIFAWQSFASAADPVNALFSSVTGVLQ